MAQCGIGHQDLKDRQVQDVYVCCALLHFSRRYKGGVVKNCC